MLSTGRVIIEVNNEARNDEILSYIVLLVGNICLNYVPMMSRMAS